MCWRRASVWAGHLFPGQPVCLGNRGNHANREGLGCTDVAGGTHLPHHLLNILSRKSQKALESFTALSSNDLKERLAFWVLSLTQQKSTDIRIICKQKDLYSFFGVQRSVFLSTLDELKENGIIDYDSKEILILDRARLKDLLLAVTGRRVLTDSLYGKRNVLPPKRRKESSMRVRGISNGGVFFQT